GLFGGGVDGIGASLGTALKYDAGAASPTTSNVVNNAMVQQRADFTGTLLLTGKVLIVGGVSGNSAAELFDPTAGSGTFTAISGSSVGEDKRSHTAVRILDPINQTGKVLIS